MPTFASLPGLQSFNFDPFADEDSSTSSSASERELEAHTKFFQVVGSGCVALSPGSMKYLVAL